MRSLFSRKERVPQLDGAEKHLSEDKPEEEEDPTPPMSREGAIHGWVFKRGKLKSRAWRKRYAVYEPTSQYFTYYDSREQAAADTKRKGRTKVTQSSAVSSPLMVCLACPHDHPRARSLPARAIALAMSLCTHRSPYVWTVAGEQE
jgi:hypothetical protein